MIINICYICINFNLLAILTKLQNKIIMLINGVDTLRTKFRLNIEHSQNLECTLTGNNIQYGGSSKQKNYTDKSFESLQLADVTIFTGGYNVKIM